MSTDDERLEFTDGLRQIADFLDAHPGVPLPYLGTIQTGKLESTLDIYIHSASSDDQRADMAAIARAMGKAEKVMDGDRFRVFRRFAGIALVAQSDRDEVCRREVVGTRQVTEQIPDPDAPLITRTRIEEVVEWTCEPLLATQPGGTDA